MTGFIAGMLIGAGIGVLVMCCLAIANDSEKGGGT